ncbi:sensor domain-containing phosphodiesterase [Thalassorhabdomicrobium marinisediminis]|uniref:Diguanylate phosphodiesterase n=1 Tax=Thalassorhabdomicrobium marinisediminis TaxID=2170577 RepID=A0A2T7FT19_9RHOB|nr:EAL domain-containing protein [Thalassorhabdomicrobium marinisediminis]PVA05321.1 diguanylate phosphodiesterase [Thalassorhabdomicrobium marinisediminis]
MSDVNHIAAGIVPRMAGADGDLIANALSFARAHLGMEVAYLARVAGDQLIFEVVIAPGLEDVVDVGRSLPFADTISRQVWLGHLPPMIADIEDYPQMKGLPVLQSIAVRAQVSIPITRPDGSLYGMFCCFDRAPCPTLNSRDLEVLRAFASLSSDQINRRLGVEAAVRAKRLAIEKVLDHQAFDIALQPIKSLRDQSTTGFEALCRFSPTPYRPPNIWFDDAAEAGLQVSLELRVIEAALTLLPRLPDASYLAVNTSPATLASGKIAPLLAGYDGARVVIEITEHAEIGDIDAMLLSIDRLRELGVRIAIDDAGAGYSGLQQIIRLHPDIIKLDMSLTHDVDKDLARRSLASAMVRFAQDTNARVVAEGIETEAELRTLRTIGIEMGQGYHLARPGLAQDVLALPKTA